MSENININVTESGTTDTIGINEAARGPAGPAGPSGVTEAPEDGNTYGRKDAGWEQVADMVYSAHIGLTGVANGSGCLTPNVDDTKFDISDGFGYVLDLVTVPDVPTITRVDWSGETALTVDNLLTQNVTFVGINAAGAVVQQTLDFTQEERRSIIVLGVLNHVTGVVATTTDDATAVDGYLASDLAHAIGDINSGGNNFNAASTDLTIRKESGTSFIVSGNRCSNANDPNRVTSAAIPSASFLYIYDDGAGGVTATPATDIDPDQYDDGSGTLTSVGNNRWTNQLCYFFPGPNVVLVRYGNEEFSTQAGRRISK